MKFKQYLTESGKWGSLTLEKTVDIIKINAVQIFRGTYIDSKYPKIYTGYDERINSILINTNEMPDMVTPAKVSNRWVTGYKLALLMDNLPSWVGYPKKIKGLVCWSNRASVYKGKTYHVIPFDNVTRIGISSSFDLVEDFTYGLNGYTWDVFNDYLNETFRKLNIKIVDYTSLVKALELVNETVPEGRYKFGVFKPGRNIMLYLDEILSPIKNMFKMGIDNVTFDKAMWIQGNSILINKWGLDDVINEYNKGV